MSHAIVVITSLAGLLLIAGVPLLLIGAPLLALSERLWLTRELRTRYGHRGDLHTRWRDAGRIRRYARKSRLTMSK